MKQKRDKFLLAFLIGVIVFIPLELYLLTLKYLGLTNVDSLEFTSLLVSPVPNGWLGILTGPAVAGLVVVFIYYSSLVIGKDYLIIKGAIIGAITQGIIMSIRSLFSGYQMPTVSHFVHASASFVAGALAGFLVKKYLLNTEQEKGTRENTKEEQIFSLHRRPMHVSKPLTNNDEQPIKLKKPKKL